MAQQTFFVIGGHYPRNKEDVQTIFNYFLINGLKSVKKYKNPRLYAFIRAGGGLMRRKNHQ